jgi:hypothetical protein
VLPKGKGRAEGGRGSDLDRLDGLQVLSGVRVEGMPEIPVALTVEPELGRRAEKAREPKGGFRGDSSLGVDDLVDAREGNMDPRVVDSDAVPSCPISGQCFESIRRWRFEVLELFGLVELVEPSLGHPPELRRT